MQNPGFYIKIIKFYIIMLAIFPPVECAGLVKEGVEDDVAVALVELAVHTLLNLQRGQ